MAVPDGLGSRGQALWASLGQTSEHTPSGVLAMEACRAADRLDGLADVIAGKGVLRLMHFRHLFELDDEDRRVFELKVDHALQEVRLQAAALKALLESPVLKVSESKGANPVDAVAARREARRAAAQGPHGA